MVIVPVASMEEHGHQAPIGTDFLNGLERAWLIAQRTDVLFAPHLPPGNPPYHMGVPGTITLPAETIQLVCFQAAQSVIAHGFQRFLLLNRHGGNLASTRDVADLQRMLPDVVAGDPAATRRHRGLRGGRRGLHRTVEGAPADRREVD